jgi:hypothetical protein
MRKRCEYRMSTNEPTLLPKRRSEAIEHGQLLGVAFDCMTPNCITLSWTQGRGSKGAQYDASWTEIVCAVCGTSYLIEWPASDGDGTTVVQRILAKEQSS